MNPSSPTPVPDGPTDGRLPHLVGRLRHPVRLVALQQRYGPTRVLGLYALANGFVSIALMALAALISRQPFVFPSLGPTAFLLFSTPKLATASPRNTLLGHLVGVGAGYLSLVVFGLTDAGPAIATGVSGPRVLAAGLSLGLTAGLMVWLNVPHPPAGATTLIISLGILARPEQLAVLMLAVFLLVLQAIVINRLAGVDYPLWAQRPEAEPGAHGSMDAPPDAIC